MWFTEFADPGRIGRITPAGAATEFTSGLTPNSMSVGIAAGPDDNVWFTEFANPGRIAKIGAGCVAPPLPPQSVANQPTFTG
jgi:streptogramin lyase